MKIIVSGKGGSGKSTLSTLIAKGLNQLGYTVMLIDADESNRGLHRLLGVAEPTVFLDNLGGKKEFKTMLNKGFPKGNTDDIFKPDSGFDDIPEECVAHVNGIRLLSIGKIHHAGEGCACPMGVLSKTVLSKLVVKENEIVIVDAEAGLEHFGRGVDAGCDLIIGVVDPTYESFMLAEKMHEMAVQAEKEIVFVCNKVDDISRDVVQKQMADRKVIEHIPLNPDVFKQSLEGKQLDVQLPQVEVICKYVSGVKEALS